MKNLINVLGLLLAISLGLHANAQTQPSLVFKNFALSDAQSISLHDACIEGCTVVSSTGRVQNVQISEAIGRLDVRGQIADYKVLDQHHAPFRDANGAIELSVDIGSLQTAQARMEQQAADHKPGDVYADFYNGVHSDFTGTATAEGKQIPVRGFCALHVNEGGPDALTSDRRFVCTIDLKSLNLDNLVVSLVWTQKRD